MYKTILKNAKNGKYKTNANRKEGEKEIPIGGGRKENRNKCNNVKRGNHQYQVFCSEGR